MSSHHHDHHHDTPEEQLEKSLEKAVKDPAYRTLFYRTLLDSTVYILAESGVQDKGELIIAPNAELNVQHWEIGWSINDSLFLLAENATAGG